MVFEMELLDALSLMSGCCNLSDLRYLNKWRRIQLVHTLDKISANAVSLAEWNDALTYLTRASPQETAEAARDQLIRSLTLAGEPMGNLVPKLSTEKQQEETTT